MRILRHGWYFYQNNNEHIVQCRDCECEFQYNEDDTHIEKSIFPYIDNDGKPQYYMGKYVNCPECGCDNLLRTYEKFE